jgi:hypothetical protein
MKPSFKQQLGICFILIMTCMYALTGCPPPYEKPLFLYPIVISKPIVNNPTEVVSYELPYSNIGEAKSFVTCATDRDGLHCWGEFSVDQAVLDVWISSGMSNVFFPMSPPTSMDLEKGLLCINNPSETFCERIDRIIVEALGLGEAIDPYYSGNYSKYSLTNFTNPTMIRTNGKGICVLGDLGLECEGITKPIPILNNPTDLSLSEHHACAIDADGLKCWELDNGGLFQSQVPANLINPVQVSTGRLYTCGLDDNGVQCWGPGLISELVANVPILNSPTQIVSTEKGVCALEFSGVVCWDALGALNVPLMSNPTKLATSGMCAIDGSDVICW